MQEQDLKKSVLIRIVDDDEEVRESLCFMLQCRGWRTAVYESACAFLKADPASFPGCLLLDIRMPDMSGVELQQHMKENRMKLPIVFITGHADVDTAVMTLKMGALDFIQKPIDAGRLLTAIENASAISLAQKEGRLTVEQVNDIFDAMSAREKLITGLLINGVTNRDIAQRFALSERTVQGHRNNIYHKLRVHNYQELIEQVKGADVALLGGE